MAPPNPDLTIRISSAPARFARQVQLARWWRGSRVSGCSLLANDEVFVAQIDFGSSFSRTKLNKTDYRGWRSHAWAEHLAAQDTTILPMQMIGWLTRFVLTGFIKLRGANDIAQKIALNHRGMRSLCETQNQGLNDKQIGCGKRRPRIASFPPSFEQRDYFQEQPMWYLRMI